MSDLESELTPAVHAESAPSDRDLMAKVRAGETERFADLIGRYRPALLRVARSRLGEAAAAEDAVQETFLAAFRWRQSYDARFGFRTWLWTILLNQCRRLVRRRSRRPTVQNWSDDGSQQRPLEMAVTDRDDQAPLGHLLAAERRELLERLLGQLKPTQADALRLRFFGGLKFDEIADCLGCSLGTAKNRVREGLLRMSQLLSQAERAAPEVSGYDQNEGQL